MADNSVQHGGSTGGFHPGHPQNHAEYQELVFNYAWEDNFQCTADVDVINGSGNPCVGYGDDNYLSIFTGNLYVKQAGNYRFAVDGDEAVEVLINGNAVTGWYGGHGKCDCTSHSSDNVYLSNGVHTVEFRHEDATGGDNYSLWWNGPDSGNLWQIVPKADFSSALCDLADLINGGFCAESLTQDVYTSADR